jgi:uncharacterized protein
VKYFWAILASIGCLTAPAAEVIPPVPAKYFNDYAHVTSQNVAVQLNLTLEDFERQTSEQILVAVFPKMESDSSIEDYTVRVARAWRVGQQKQNNGAVLFVFVQEHKMFLQVGYGLEGVLPDALCKRIIDEQIAPRFKAGDFDAGLVAGVQSIIAATKGEYKGTGTTVAESSGGSTRSSGTGLTSTVIIIGVFVLFAMLGVTRRRRGFFYSGGGWGGGWSSGGGGGGGFSSGGGGGGGFSGGGGSFGGGGAGGSW